MSHNNCTKSGLSVNHQHFFYKKNCDSGGVWSSLFPVISTLYHFGPRQPTTSQKPQESSLGSYQQHFSVTKPLALQKMNSARGKVLHPPQPESNICSHIHCLIPRILATSCPAHLGSFFCSLFWLDKQWKRQHEATLVFMTSIYWAVQQ